jgi:hypothetical protein
MPRQNNIRFRKGSYSQWDANSTTVLGSGEPGFATDFNILKVGDGSKEWSDLPAINDNLITVVRNDTGSTINKMSVVYINGALGDTPRISLSIASGEATSSKTYGLVVNNIASGGVGTVIVEGTLRNLDTNSQFSAISEGTSLWLSPTVSGGITSTKPHTPNHSVFVGTLIRKHSQQGVINVKIQNGYELEELHNVATTGATNGQFLQYNSGSGLWVPTSSGNFNSLSINGVSAATDNTTIVRTSGNQTISGIKTFSTLNSDTISATINLSGPAGFMVTDEGFFFVNATNNFNVDTENGVANFFNSMYVDTSNVGIGTSSPGAKLHVIGSGIISNDLIVGGNLVVNGTTVTANVDTVTVEDPIITLGLSSGNIVPNLTHDRGLALVRGTGLTAFMGWDTSASQFVMLSSGIAGVNSGTYTAGTYGDLQLNKLNSAEINVNELISIISSGISFSNFIKFNDSSTANSPSLGSISNGTRLLLNENNTDGHNAIGIQYAGINGTWFSVPSGGTFTFYNGTAPQLTINSTSLNYGSLTASPNGSITSASWDASTIAVNKGGTGRTSYSNGQLLIGSGTSLVANTLTAGTGISITNGSGTITINTSGLQTSLSNPVTGTGIANHIPYWSSTSGLLADSSQLYWDNTNDRLGIGTSSPSARLHSEISDGNSVFLLQRSSSQGGLSVDFTGATSNLRSLNGFKIFTGSVAANSGTERLHITSGGDVGIGTSSPSDKLNVVGNISAGTLSTTQGKFIAYGSSSQPNLLFEGFDATGKARISTNSGANRQLKIENDGASNTLGVYIEGDVGIGTDTPTSKLHVIGSGLFSGDVRASGSFIGGSGTASLPSFEFVNDPDTGLFSPAANAFGISTSGVERLRVDSAGNIGIGTTNPGYKLQVSGSFGATTKSFRIDHPSKPGFSLEYGSLESPYHGVRLTGRGTVIKGIGMVSLPSYLKDLIHDDDTLNIQITNIKHGKTIYVDSIDLKNDCFIVKADRAKSLGDLHFFWTLTGVRKDVENLVVEKRN